MTMMNEKLPTYDSILNEAFFRHILPSDVQLTSLFTKKSNSGTAKNQLNKILAESPQYTNVILGMVMYPALSWSLYGEKISDVIDLGISSGDAAEFAETKQMLHDAFGFDNKLFLANREKYYHLCHKIIDTYDTALQNVASYPESGVQLQNVLRLIMDMEPEKGKGVSRFEIIKYLKMAVSAIYQLCGKDMDELIPTLIQFPITSMLNQDDENLYVYHNVKVLLREYTRLYWGNPNAADCTSHILRCKSPEEILKLSERESGLYSADIVLKFLLLIAGAIALVSYYPVNGGRYNMILRSLVSNRTITTPDGRSAYVREQELARIHNMQPQKFSAMKQEAFALLGLLLWGYDGRILMSILTNDKTKVYFLDD